MFRNRVMYPIIGITGEVIAFGGRVMDDSKPKYLNSSDTPAFNKRRNLFALNFAKNNCEERIILCEGYMDVIALHGAGFTSAVATLGTAITPEQARMMKRYTKEVLICYDSDEAGQNAASKAFTLLGEVGLPAKIIKVKNAKDPDEYIKKYGSAAFKKLMESGKSEFDFRFDSILARYDIEDSEEKIKAIKDTELLISDIYSGAQREVYIARIAKKFEISPEALRHDIEIIIKSKTKTVKKRENAEMIRKAEGYGDRVNPDFIKNPKAAKAEETILGILMLHPEYIVEMRTKNLLFPASDFKTSFGRKVFMTMLEGDQPFDELALNEKLSMEEISRLTYLKVTRESLKDNSLALLLECHKTLLSSSEGDGLDLSDLIKLKRKNNNTEQ
jgi:DNA primase